MTKLIVIDNQVIIREGIRGLLEKNTEMTVVGGGNIYEAIELTNKYLPDVALIDFDSVKYSIEVIKDLLERHPLINVLILAEDIESHILKELIAFGVNGFTTKHDKQEHLINAINSVNQGQPYLSSMVGQTILTEFRKLLTAKGTGAFLQLDIRIPFHLLTKRECDVLQLLADGQSNRQMAETLSISDKTIKNHVSNILLKMEVKDRTQAVVKAIKNGWVHLN